MNEIHVPAVIESRSYALRITSWDELCRFADFVCESSMVPAGFKDRAGKPRRADVVLATQFGLELGLTPMQAIQNVMVTNGRPSLWGDALPGLVYSSGKCAYIKEWFEGEWGSDEFTAWCETQRKGNPHVVRHSFSIADAKLAKLWGKTGYEGKPTPWITNPRRMLQQRARSYTMRDAYPDVLKGLASAEEVQDYEIAGFALPPEPPPPAEPGIKASVLDDLAPRVDRALHAISRTTTRESLLAIREKLDPLISDCVLYGRTDMVARLHKGIEVATAALIIGGHPQAPEATELEAEPEELPEIAGEEKLHSG